MSVILYFFCFLLCKFSFFGQPFSANSRLSADLHQIWHDCLIGCNLYWGERFFKSSKTRSRRRKKIEYRFIFFSSRPRVVFARCDETAYDFWHIFLLYHLGCYTFQKIYFFQFRTVWFSQSRGLMKRQRDRLWRLLFPEVTIAPALGLITLTRTKTRNYNNNLCIPRTPALFLHYAFGA